MWNNEREKWLTFFSDYTMIVSERLFVYLEEEYG